MVKKYLNDVQLGRLLLSLQKESVTHVRNHALLLCGEYDDETDTWRAFEYGADGNPTDVEISPITVFAPLCCHGGNTGDLQLLCGEYDDETKIWKAFKYNTMGQPSDVEVSPITVIATTGYCCHSNSYIASLEARIAALEQRLLS